MKWETCVKRGVLGIIRFFPRQFISFLSKWIFRSFVFLRKMPMRLSNHKRWLNRITRVIEKFSFAWTDLALDELQIVTEGSQCVHKWQEYYWEMYCFWPRELQHHHSKQVAFLKSFSRVLECFVKKTRLQKLINSALQTNPSSCAVKVFGLPANWSCLGSKSVGVARNAELIVSV